jgi:outer membrane protein TolC
MKSRKRNDDDTRRQDWKFDRLFYFSFSARPNLGAAIFFQARDAGSTALENNNELKSFESSVSAEKADIGISRSYLLPQINLEESFVRTNNPTGVFSIKLNEGRFKESDFEISSLNNPDPVSDFETNISVEQPILAIQEALALKSANKDYLAKREEFGRLREYVAFRVVETYIQVGTAKEFVRVARKALEDAREQLRIANSRFKSGMGLYSDTLRAETAVTEAEQQLVSTEKNLKVRSVTRLLLGRESVDTEAVTENSAQGSSITRSPLRRTWPPSNTVMKREDEREHCDAGTPRIGERNLSA